MHQLVLMHNNYWKTNVMLPINKRNKEQGYH